jgi:hypothetical protein
MWRRSNANLDLFVASQRTDIPLFIAHSGVPFKPCFYFVRSRGSDCRTTHDYSGRRVGRCRSVWSVRWNLVRRVTRQFVGRRRLAGFTHRRWRLGLRISRWIFLRGLGWMTRRRGRNFGRFDRHLDCNHAVAVGLRPAAACHVHIVAHAPFRRPVSCCPETITTVIVRCSASCLEPSPFRLNRNGGSSLLF